MKKLKGKFDGLKKAIVFHGKQLCGTKLLKPIALLAVCCAFPHAYGAETILSEDFSTAVLGTTWASWKSADAVGSCEYSKVGGNKAAGSQEIKIGPANPLKASLCFIRHFPAKAGESVRVSVYTRSTQLAPDAKVVLALQGLDAGGQLYGTPAESSEFKGVVVNGEKWRKLSLQFTIPPTGIWEKTEKMMCTLGVSNTAAGTVCFDDFEVVKFGQNEPVTDDFSSMNWASWKLPETKGEFLHNLEVGNKDPGALEIKIGPGNPVKNGLVFMNRFPVKPGESYTALVFVKTKGLPESGNTSLSFQGQDAKNQFIPDIPVKTVSLAGAALPTDEWKRMVLTFKIPNEGNWAKTEYLLCTLGASGAESGQVFFDDFEFSRDIE